MTEKTTEELLNELAFISELDDYDLNINFKHSLSDYLNLLLEKYSLERKEVIKQAGIDMTFGYQIFTGKRKAARNKLLQLVFAMGIHFQEAQRVLYAGGVNMLYPRSRRDAILIYCLKNRYNLQKTDEILYEYEEDPISSI